MLASVVIAMLLGALYLMWGQCRVVELRLVEVEGERDELAEALVDKERMVEDLEHVLRGMKTSSGWKPLPASDRTKDLDIVLDRLAVELADPMRRRTT